MGPTVTRLVQVPLAVLNLDNQVQREIALPVRCYACSFEVARDGRLGLVF